MAIKLKIKKKGSAKSGNWGHAGRPGKRGGSSARGGGFLSLDPGKADWDYGDKRVEDFMNANLDNNFIYASDEERAAMKMAIVSDIAAQTGLDEELINDYMTTWAYTSNDNDMRALSMQEAIEEEFGIPMSDWQNSKIAPFNEYKDLQKQRTNIKAQIDDLVYAEGDLDIAQVKRLSRQLTDVDGRMTYMNKNVSGLKTMSSATLTRDQEKKLVRATYNNTQAKLKEAGYEKGDVITLHRGVKNEYSTVVPGKQEGESISYKGNAVESWSTDYDVAKDFATGEGIQDDYGAIFSMSVPVANVFSTARSGVGCLTEGEFVVFGNVKGSMVGISDLFDPAYLEEAEGE